MVELLNQYWPIVAFLAIVLAVMLLSMLLLRETAPPYQKRGSLLTKAELKFLRSLRDAVQGDWSICAMVRMADLIQVRPKTPKHQAWLNRIRAKHIDFVLCDPGTMEAKLAIELDDRSHSRPDRIHRDRFVNGALAAAGLPLLRVPVQTSYEARELRKSICQQIGC